MAHPRTTVVVRQRQYKGRWRVQLSCGHVVWLSLRVKRPKPGALFECPERPIGVVLVDDVTGAETPYDPFGKSGISGHRRAQQHEKNRADW